MSVDDDEHEAQRLANQRKDDLGAARDRENAREYQRGQRDAADDAHTAEQDRQLEVINGSIGDVNTALKAMEARLAKVERSFGEFVAVAKALAEKTVSTRTFVLGACGLAVMVIALFIGSGHAP